MYVVLFINIILIVECLKLLVVAQVSKSRESLELHRDLKSFATKSSSKRERVVFHRYVL
jgi:hypothetical protein